MRPRIDDSRKATQTQPFCRLTQRPAKQFGPVRCNARLQRRGGVLIVVLVILMIAGMLAYQSVRTLLVVRKGHSQQAQIAQACELLDLARQLEQSPSQRDLIQPGRYTIVLQVGDEFGKLELVYANQVEQGGQHQSNAKTMWIARIPVDSQGHEVAGKSTVVVSSER